MIIDAGVGTPAHAAAAMELGYDAVLLNTAVAKAGNPVAMAHAFALGIEAGRLGYCADPIPAARHGRAVDAADRPRLFRSAQTCLTGSIPSSTAPPGSRGLLPCGVKLVQLRVKDRPIEDVRREIRTARTLCLAAGAQLVVNDYWREAIDLSCTFVHLGQDDLEGGRYRGDSRGRISSSGFRPTTNPSFPARSP